MPASRTVNTIGAASTLAHALAALAVVLALLAGTLRPEAGAAAVPVPIAYAGWAMDAYPGDSVAALQAQMQRQLAAGANIIWLGHNNPGEVVRGKGEPGLSYAVWRALQDATSPRRADAVDITLAVQHALDAARALGAPVVLPIGYQIQMGVAWSQTHAEDLRLDSEGHVYDNGGKSASFYAPDYQHDILAYYRWVDATFVRPYGSTIKMLNLADEPSDGDYSRWADAAFKQQNGYSFGQVGANALRQLQLGRFQSEYIARYAAWSAGQWLTIDPAVKVTLSFDGGWGRYKHEGPNLEAIFQMAPANLVVTFDAYPRDGLYNTPLRTGDLVTLFSLVRTLGHYSALYHRPLWLWSAGNSWGLNGASSDPGTIADAAANAIYLAQLARETGGGLQGIAVWNYNIKGQGLFHDTHPYTYDPEQMFTRVSSTFPLLRRIMAAPSPAVGTLILASDTPDLQHAGRIRAMRAVDSYSWSALAAFAHDDVAAPIVTHLGREDLARVQTVIVLDRAAGDLTAFDRRALAALIARGGTVVASPAIAALLAPSTLGAATVASGGTPDLSVRRYLLRRGTVYAIAGGPVERLFGDDGSTWAAGVVQSILHVTVRATGYVLSQGGATLLYAGLASPSADFTLTLPLVGAPATLDVYGSDGAKRQAISLSHRTGSFRVTVTRRAYALALQP